jgi:hypothetical protein
LTIGPKFASKFIENKILGIQENAKGLTFENYRSQLEKDYLTKYLLKLTEIDMDKDFGIIKESVYEDDLIVFC